MKYFIVSILMGGAVFFGATAQTLAAGPLSSGLGNLDKAAKPTQLSGDLTGTVGTLVKGVLAMVGTIFLVLTIYAGILWMTAAGNEEQVAKAKSIITATVIGLFITMSAYAITSFVGNRLSGNSSTTSQ
jgi:cbb3-type cytochrome oxidase subunit 3